MHIPDIPSYFGLKAIHIIFMVSYFAGIFYLVRLFVYYIDTYQKTKEEGEILRKQYIYMMHRLWDIIIVPAGVIMTIAGVFMMLNTRGDIGCYILKQPWFHIKLAFLLGLAWYHYWCWKTVRKLKKNGVMKTTSVRLRMMNEVATILLFAVVFIVIFKDHFMNMWLSLLISFVVLVSAIMLVVKIVNRAKK